MIYQFLNDYDTLLTFLGQFPEKFKKVNDL